MKKILIINPFGIGDVLFTSPLIKNIRAFFPGCLIGYWCNLRVADILKNNPDIGRIFALSRGDLKKIFNKSIFSGLNSALGLFNDIKKEHFEICLDFSLDHRYSLVAKLAGISKRIGFDYKGRGRFLTHRLKLESYSDKHMVEYYADLLSYLDIKAKPERMSLSLAGGSEDKVRHKFSCLGIKPQDLVIGIAPGAGGSWGKNAALKQWMPVRFAQLADRLIDELKAKIILLGDESEKPISQIITSAMKNKPLDLTGKTSLEDLAGIIKELKFLVTNDGGPMHMAVALGVKTAAIFGPVDDKVYGPYPPGPDYVVIKSNISCRPCYKNFKMDFCGKDRECLKSISVDKVFDALKKGLNL